MKILVIVLTVGLLLPCSSFAMDIMSDNALETVTGQAGITIYFEVVRLDVNLQGVAWGDDNGYGAGNSAHVRFDAVGGSGIVGIGIATVGIQTMTIDVDSVQGIVFGLPDITVNVTTPDSIRISTGAGVAPSSWTSPGTSNTLLDFAINDLSVSVTSPERLSIKPH